MAPKKNYHLCASLHIVIYQGIASFISASQTFISLELIDLASVILFVRLRGAQRNRVKATQLLTTAAVIVPAIAEKPGKQPKEKSLCFFNEEKFNNGKSLGCGP